MILSRTIFGCALSILAVVASQGNAEESAQTHKIVLVAGETAKIDKVGHHDYLAGCQCLAELLAQTDGVTITQVTDGWPEDVSVFDNARCVVFYTDGGGKQAFLASPERIATMQSMVDAGVGLVMIHQAVDFPDNFAEQAKLWIGGIYQDGKSGRGHWDSAHVDFPNHPITRGVTPWQLNDGWLNELQFVDGLKGVTPLVWSGKQYAGSRAGLDEDIVGWAYDRPTGGRSFSFTGLDAHSAWSFPGMRQLMVNGILWSANVDVPEEGAPCTIDEARLETMQTPRQAKETPVKKPKKKV